MFMASYLKIMLTRRGDKPKEEGRRFICRVRQLA